MHTQSFTQDAPSLPDTPQGCRERLAALHDEIAALRIRIATTDIRRQEARKTLDPFDFVHTKTALRQKRQEAQRLAAHLATLNRGGAREGLKDTLIEVLRAEVDDARWSLLLERARALHAQRGVAHG